MVKRARDVMEEVPSTGYDVRLAGTQGTIRFEVRDVGTWRYRIDDGNFAVLEGPGDADLSLVCDEADFVEAIEGRQNFVTATLQGRIDATGNLALLLKFHGSRSRAPSKATPLAEVP